MSPREEVELMALRFLKAAGGDAIKVVEGEEEFAAALLYIDLARQGFAKTEKCPVEGMKITITENGLARIGQ